MTEYRFSARAASFSHILARDVSSASRLAISTRSRRILSRSNSQTVPTATRAISHSKSRIVKRMKKPRQLPSGAFYHPAWTPQGSPNNPSLWHGLPTMPSPRPLVSRRRLHAHHMIGVNGTSVSTFGAGLPNPPILPGGIGQETTPQLEGPRCQPLTPAATTPAPQTGADTSVASHGATPTFDKATGRQPAPNSASVPAEKTKNLTPTDPRSSFITSSNPSCSPAPSNPGGVTFNGNAPTTGSPAWQRSAPQPAGC